ncbi:hypothetical protein [Frigoribacterium sp. CFBP 8766]|uniref:hypothetical protein n=1 Tax=Frigoribacterium sp. CFBP 8766 TaxID=2775273 RepID=UPI001FCF1BBE|nr:hypothetical protein [Frigoribacterium sp. CFBP 8766]
MDRIAERDFNDGDIGENRRGEISVPDIKSTRKAHVVVSFIQIGLKPVARYRLVESFPLLEFQPHGP